MPDIVVHNSMGKKVFDNLRSEISSHINYDIFQFGVMAPDVYCYYRYFALPLRHGLNRRSSILHNVRTGDFIIALAKRARNKDIFSYLSGVLCHYALDGSVHPYVNELEQSGEWSHTEIEKKLDQLELLKQGKKISERSISKELLPKYLPEKMKADMNAAYKEVYGWDNTWEQMKTSYRHMRQFTWIIEDPSGILCAAISNNLVKRFHPKFSGLSYRGNYPDSIDLSWFPSANDKAVKDAVIYIDACYEYVENRMSEKELRKVVGNRSYVTGEEIKDTPTY